MHHDHVCPRHRDRRWRNLSQHNSSALVIYWACLIVQKCGAISLPVIPEVRVEAAAYGRGWNHCTPRCRNSTQLGLSHTNRVQPVASVSQSENFHAPPTTPTTHELHVHVHECFVLQPQSQSNQQVLASPVRPFPTVGCGSRSSCSKELLRD